MESDLPIRADQVLWQQHQQSRSQIQFSLSSKLQYPISIEQADQGLGKIKVLLSTYILEHAIRAFYMKIKIMHYL